MKNFIDEAQQAYQDKMDAFREYTQSEALDRDLDQLAERLQLNTDEFQKLSEIASLEDRNRAKAGFLFKRAKKEIVQAAEVGGVFALFSRKSKVILAVTLLAAGFKGASIAMECYQVFGSYFVSSSKRRQALRVV